MLRKKAWLLAIALILPGLVQAGGEDAPHSHAPAPARSSSGTGKIPYSKSPRNDNYVGNEHAHPVEGIYFPPQSHHYQDLDTAPNDMLNRSVRILRTTNKAQLNRYVPIVYDFKNVNPFAVLRFMRRPIQMEEGAIFTFMNPNGTAGKALIAVPEYQVEYMLDLMQTIDRPNLTTGDGSRRIYRQLKHRRANISDDPVLDDSAFIDQFAVYLTTNDHLVIVDPEQNAVFIEDAPSGADWLDAAITAKLDVPTPQALLNTKIYEVKASNNSRIGLDFIAWKNGPGANLFAIGGFAERGRVSLRSGGSSTMSGTNGLGSLPLPRSDFESNGYNFAYRYEIHSAFLDYLATKGKAKVLNSAKIAALNTRSATISATDQILYYPVQVSDPSGIRARGDAFDANSGRTVIGTTNELVESEEYPYDLELSPVQVGLTLDLTPLIYENGLDLEISGCMSSYNGFDDTGYPVINSRDIETSVRMKEGEEMILGGITRTIDAKATNKVPVLGSIPILGYLFGGDNIHKEKNEVIVAITAEKIDRFTAKGGGVSAADQAIIKQGEGSDIIAPATTFGFDQFGLDSNK